MNNNIINAIYIIIILYLLYNIYQDYIYHIDNKNNYILCVDDYEKNLDSYSDSELFKILNNLPDSDKKFLNDYIIYTVIKHKTEKPNLNKKINRLKYDIILPSIVSNIHGMSLFSILKSFRVNLLNTFSSNVF